MGATIKDIAKNTGLGIATISKYINGGNVLDKNKIAIDLAIKELDYTVNEFARSLKTSKSMTVGVVIPELSNIFITSIITVIEDLLRKKGYSVIVCDCGSDEKLEVDVIDFMMRKRVDGIIIMPVAHSGKHLERAINNKIPIVMLDRVLDDIECDAVMVDNIGAAYQATNYLIENNHENIGIIVGPQDIFTSKQRLVGYKNSLINANIRLNEDYIIYGNYTLEGGYRGMIKLLKESKEISAIFVTNYEMTLGAIIAINELGIKIPEDISFIGFDNLQLSKIVKPKLSIVEQPLEELGLRTARIMLERLNEKQPTIKQKIELDTTLIKMDSVSKI